MTAPIFGWLRSIRRLSSHHPDQPPRRRLRPAAPLLESLEDRLLPTLSSALTPAVPAPPWAAAGSQPSKAAPPPLAPPSPMAVEAYGTDAAAWARDELGQLVHAPLSGPDANQPLPPPPPQAGSGAGGADFQDRLEDFTSPAPEAPGTNAPPAMPAPAPTPAPAYQGRLDDFTAPAPMAALEPRAPQAPAASEPDRHEPAAAPKPGRPAHHPEPRPGVLSAPAPAPQNRPAPPAVEESAAAPAVIVAPHDSDPAQAMPVASLCGRDIGPASEEDASSGDVNAPPAVVRASWPPALEVRRVNYVTGVEEALARYVGIGSESVPGELTATASEIVTLDAAAATASAPDVGTAHAASFVVTAVAPPLPAAVPNLEPAAAPAHLAADEPEAGPRGPAAALPGRGPARDGTTRWTVFGFAALLATFFSAGLSPRNLRAEPRDASPARRRPAAP